jgi:hypothetical protein
MTANRTQPSPLMNALHKLNEYPALAICKETPVPMPTSRFVTNHMLATHIVRSTEGCEFIPDESAYQTYAILRSANEAWRHDKLPALAVCAFSKSPDPLREATGIQARTVDQFLGDLQSAHRMVPALGESPAYIIRHYNGPGDNRDDVVLPAHANLVVYQPQGINPNQLAALFEYVASVQGKIILCDDRRELASYHPELTDAVERSLDRAIPRSLRKDLAPHESLVEKPGTVSIAPGPDSNSISPRSDQPSFSDTAPARSYLIYHARSEKPAEFPNGYVLVAKVQADNIHRALSHSQNLGGPWTENPGVVAFTRKPRSTQPGDIICHNGTPKRVGATDFEAVTCMEPSRNRSQKPEPAPDCPEPDAPQPDRPRRTFKP